MAGKMMGTEETARLPTVVELESDTRIDAALVPRSVFVTGYKPTTMWEDLVIHFQRMRHGGGDIDSIVMSKQGAAVITFDSPEVVKTVLQTKQRLNGVALIVKPYEESMEKVNCDYEVSSHVTSVTPPAIQSFEVEPQFIKVFVKAHKTEVDEIEAEYHVRVPTEPKRGKISLIPKEGCSSEEYYKACDLFIDLYQRMAQAMKMERFSLRSVKYVVLARKKIREMSKTFPVYVELAKDQMHWVMYGEQRDLEAALEFLRKEEIEIKRESDKDKGTGEFQVSSHDENAMDLDPPDSSEGSQSKDKLETYIGGVKVSVYKGDLTSERVDVIVNAANNYLRHDGGVAKAIIDKGGKVIQVESNMVIARRGKLKDGEVVVTNSGYLPCKKLVHAVGPDFRRVGLSQYRIILRLACISSLSVAQDYTSIALPAIGSGGFGMPKDECAQVMFSAVEEFVKQRNPKKKTITDIRFVNIDDPSYQAFRNEFISRYGNNQEHFSRSISKPSDGAEGVINSSPSSSWASRGKGKSNHSFGNSQPSTKPGDVVSSLPKNTPGSSDATNDHPFSNFNLSSLSNTSYSGAVKNITGGDTGTRLPTAQEPGGAEKKGYYPLHLATMDRKHEAPRNLIISDTKPAIERKTEEAGLLNPSEILAEKQDSKTMKQSSDENNNWRQVQSDVAQMRQALDEEKRARNIRKQELRQKETVLIKILEGNLCEQQQARTRLLEELSQARTTCNELRERMQNEQAQIHQKEMIVDQLRKELDEQKQVIGAISQAHKQEIEALSQAHEQEIRMVRIAHREQERLVEVERRQKTTSEERLRGKETIIDQLQSKLGEEQQARNRLEERLQAEMVSSQTYQQEIQTKENAKREQQRLLEEERQQKTDLEERLRNLELQMQDERNRYLSNERELQSAVSAAQEELTEHQRRQPHDWIIQREEVLLSESVLGKGAWGSVHQGTFRSCQVAVKVIHELILSPHNRRLFEREMSIASCCRHPNLLQFIGATNDDGNPLFVTEILDISLRRLLSQRALSDEEIVSLALDIAKGLNYLHLHRPLPIIHRDISSTNVLLWRRDEGWRAKLSDYGSANFMRQCMTVNPGAIIYSAPEALTSQQSPKVDVYSFGLLLCEMCVRELPVPQEVRCQIGQVTNGALRGLIEQCVKRDPEERPTMNGIIYELEQLAQTKRM